MVLEGVVDLVPELPSDKVLDEEERTSKIMIRITTKSIPPPIRASLGRLGLM